MATVSIVVPVYKAELYVSKCIESILSQTFADFELILVEDGSPDRSGEICDGYALKDTRIKVIHGKNEGASAARNKGISAATGKYIMFCDSDDVVAPLWIEHLLIFAEEQRVVMAVSSFCIEKEGLGAEKTLSLPSREHTSVCSYFSLFEDGVAGFLWNTIYVRDIVVNNDITFRTKQKEGDFNEDLLFNLEYVKHVDSIVYTGYADYCYCIHEGSLSTSYSKQYFSKYAEKYSLWKDFIEFCFDEGDNERRSLANRMLCHFIKALDSCVDDYRKIGIIKSIKKTKEIVNSPEVQDCVALADTATESPKIINAVKKKQSIFLFGILLFHKLRRKG